MKRIVTMLACASLFGIGTASATTTPSGSIVRITPLASLGLPHSVSTIPVTKTTVTRPSMTKGSTPPAYATLPPQAGKVRSTVTTNLLGEKSWSILALGDKYISLCAPNREKMSCSPTVATSVMADIKIGAAFGPKGEPLLIFTAASGTKRTPRAIAFAINKFNARIKKQVAHFDRMAVLYAPMPRQSALTIGATQNSVMEPGSCSFDDYGELDCAGGASEGGGGNEGGNSGPTDSGCWNCNYPSGNNNGDPEPDVDPDIPVIIINGQRSIEEPMGMLPTCRPVSPFTIECGRIPPVIGGEPTELPHNIPWFPQSWCNFASVFCSAGQIPEDYDRGNDAGTSGKSISQLYDICDSIATRERDECGSYRPAADNRMFFACLSKVEDRRAQCYTTARQLTGNGAHPAP